MFLNRLIYFFSALLISLFLTKSLIRFKEKSKENKKKLNRLGGVGIVLTFLLIIFLIPELEFTRQLKGLLWGAGFILFFGIWDDFKNFSWKPQLFFQLILILILILSGYSIFYLSSPTGGMIRTDLGFFQILGKNFSLMSITLVSFWTLAIINAVSWSDGVDGLLGIIATLGATALFLVSLQAEVNQPAIAIISLVFLGSLLGFWFFNFPPAKIEAGTAGSYFVGFFLATMAIIAGTKMATTMMVLALPLVDFVWVIGARIKNKHPITKKDQRHLHYKLRRLGWSDRKIIFIWSIFIMAIMALTFFAPRRVDRLVILIAELSLITGFIYFVSKKEKRRVSH